ncbi:5'-3' exonuclease PLD4-like [Myxocyprinus asiaticus]|uniref:5'-3' exonuclease PLD4-like n=1 Tax=Myxocyprinus asiaticus TaxID=70543 RepID=UPI0022229446|nr:5'-3' exonuclease PLD4-like [Myxocyprinus asiaticus]
MPVSSRLEENQPLSSPYESLHDNYVSNKRSSKWPIAALLATGCLIVLGVLLAIAVIERLKNEDEINAALNSHPTVACYDQTASDEQSSIILVESIPRCMDFGSNVTFGKNLYEAWTDLLSLATKQIDVASFYWTLTGEDINVNSSTDRPGRDILERFKALPSRNISVRVVTSIPTLSPNSTDLKTLKENGIQVRRVNFGHLTKGILHTKFWIVDRKHLYIGSANMDWRALTQVKELGVVIYNSSSLAADLQKIFQSYWVMGRSNASIPDPWPSHYDTRINKERPLLVNLSGAPSQVYIAASPPAFCPDSRTRDLDAILSIIRDAQQFIHVAVMEFYPASKFFHQHRYWPVIENALKHSAFERNVSVRLLVSCGRDTDPSVWPFLKSLDTLHSPRDNINIEVKVYVIPVGNQSHIPYARFNHNKYMVTDKVVYIGTSNWSADYFNTTAGVALVVSQDVLPSALPGNTLHRQLSAAFDRDWNSQYAIPLDELNQNHDCIFPKSTP